LPPNGVRARGLTFAACAGTGVVAPAAGRIAFAGPFRRRAGVVIIDHGGGWATLLTDVRRRSGSATGSSAGRRSGARS
jgi:septal ring factor EnvC (AmiA/AmiB activator)